MFQLKWVWKNLEGCRKRYVFALCSTAVLSMMALVNSVLTAQIMDTVFTPVKEGQGTTPELWHRLVVLVSILIGFTMFRMCFNYLSVMTYETCSQKLLFKLRRDLYANMQAQDSSFFSKNRTGDLMTRFTSDLNAIRMAIGPAVISVFDASVMTLMVIFQMMYYVSVKLTLLTLIPMLLILFGEIYYGKIIRPRFTARQEAVSDLTDYVQESFSGIAVIKAFVNEARELLAFRKINRESEKHSSGRNRSVIIF